MTWIRVHTNINPLCRVYLQLPRDDTCLGEMIDVPSFVRGLWRCHVFGPEFRLIQARSRGQVLSLGVFLSSLDVAMFVFPMNNFPYSPPPRTDSQR